MKKKLLLILTIALAILTSLAFSSCGKKGDSQSVPDSASESVSETGQPTESDSQQTSVVDPKGNGTKENPYLIKTADDLLDFADRINNPDDDGEYASSFFRLENDIDMADEKYVSAGKPVTVENEDGTTEVKGGFRGSFDGNGHKISNLTITQTLRMSVGYVGLFGYTNRANVYDLTLEGVNYVVESISGESTIGAYIGGAVGYAVLTNFVNVKTSGTVETRLLPKNVAHIGGVAGELEVYDKEKAYIAYVRNCRAAVETIVGKFDGTEDSVLEVASNGGIVGTVSCTKGAVAIVNCVSDGKVYGGQFVGGIVGYHSGSNVSIVNCVNYASVRATAKDVSYAGGIVGSARNDMIVLDSYSAGNIAGVKASSSFYKSYAGGIFGYSHADDYDMGYTAGVAAENAFHSGVVRSASYDNLNSAGTKIDKAEVDKDWFVNNLGFDADEWNFADGKISPADYDKKSGSYKLSLYANDTLVKEIEKPYTETGFSIIGLLDDGDPIDTLLFFDWGWQSGTRYRYYVPVVKDMRLDAQYGDSAEVAGTFKGKAEYHGESDAGILALYDNGTLQWVSTGIINGTYKYDGTHLLLNFFNNYGEIAGNFNSTSKTISFSIEHGMSAIVSYTFTKKDNIKVFGQYFNNDGDTFVFSDDKITLYSDNVRNNDGVSGSYTIKGDEVVIDGKLSDYFSSMKMTIKNDGTLDVDFVGSKGYSIKSNFARPVNTDHKGEKYVGKYYFPYLTISSNNDAIQSNYVIEFFADGKIEYSSKYSTTPGEYYVFGNLFRIALEGYYTTIRYDETRNFFYGAINRGIGSGSKIKTILTPCADGELVAYMVNYDVNEFVAVNDKNHYLVKDGAVVTDAVIKAEHGFANGERVTINGVDYRVKLSVTDKNNRGYVLEPLGAEEGDYTYNGTSFSLDGIKDVTGDKTGKYYVYDKFVVVVFDDDTIIGFDYTAAKAANGAVTLVAPDNHQGVWYSYKENEDGVSQKYNRLLLDGYGHVAYMYRTDDGTYNFNWGKQSGWVAYTETATGIYCEFNEHYKVEFNFYYDGQLAYCKDFDKTFGIVIHIKDGYTGTTDLPSLPDGVAGTYNGAESDGTAIVFNLKQDLTGSVKGIPFSSIYDGNDKVAFKANGVNYVFAISTKTLTYGTEAVVLTRGGEVEEIIPAMFVGSWTGNFIGFNAGTRTIIIEANGTMKYGEVTLVAEYDIAKSQIVGKTADKSYVITLTWDAKNEVMSANILFVQDYSDEYNSSCSDLKKA